MDELPGFLEISSRVQRVFLRGFAQSFSPDKKGAGEYSALFPILPHENLLSERNAVEHLLVNVVLN